MTENIITQVTQDVGFPPSSTYDDSDLNIDYNMNIHMLIRDTAFTVTRDELMSLPESILLCLFPNGVFLDSKGLVISNLSEEDTVCVNYDPGCFSYILNSFAAALKDLRLTPLPSSTSLPESRTRNSDNLLLQKPAIIDLREDLDFYVIPPVKGINAEQMLLLKRIAASELTRNKSIFSGLGYVPPVLGSTTTPTKLGPAEQHLFDMLCSSGFDADGEWGSRVVEPNRSVILSLLLIRLTNKSAPTPPELPSSYQVESDSSCRSRSKSRITMLASSAARTASRSLSRSRKNADRTQNKLLLFWRKPARKCWWSQQVIPISPNEDPFLSEIPHLNIHLRRVWTLELLVIGVQ